MHIIIGMYKELNGGDETIEIEGKVYYFTSMKDDFQENDYPYQKEIIHYLRYGGEKDDIYTPVHLKDVITGEVTKEKYWFRHDDRYSWCASIPYYIEKYNLKLSEEIENHILKKLNIKRSADN